MSIIHVLDSFSKGGLTGSQAQQRDWSPYVVHFTSWSAMAPFRELFERPLVVDAVDQLPDFVHTALVQADKLSFASFSAVLNSGFIRAQSPSEKDNIPPCVCFSECNLPGLIGHSERYGRFGFVFSKSDIFAPPLNGRPCLYMDSETYGLIDQTCSHSDSTVRNRLFGLSNVLTMPGNGKVQDFTHEREWRVFSDVPLEKLRAVLCPLDYRESVVSVLARAHRTPGAKESANEDTEAQTVEQSFAAVPVISIDMLSDWGA